MCRFGAHMCWRTSMMTHRPGRLDKCLLTITKNRKRLLMRFFVPESNRPYLDGAYPSGRHSVDVGHGRERKTGGREREKKKGRRAGGMGMGR